MKNDLLQKIKTAYENRDLKALDTLATPAFREINKNNDFRSVLMLSCNNIKHLSKIEQLEAECIMLNLEDGVSPQDKSFALVLCAIFLKEHQESNKKIVVRVNALDEGGYEEITYLNQFMPDAVRVPKIRNKDEVKRIRALLHDDIELHLSIETADAWHNLSSLKIDKRVTTFYLGILDLFADIKLSQSLIRRDNPTMLYMLSHFLITCKTMGVKPVSFVYQDFKNLEEFSKWVELEKNMGYDAKGCISPQQVLHVNSIFVDEEKELERAQIIIKLYEMHAQEGVTGFVDEEFGFIDEPVYKGALALISKVSISS
ncbi:aldolase/citrate lyase family protein [Sulfurimonas sp.]|uniref:HpcH/HpaI aldolase/citrate lyase family protein n=1 Tax=Sulfurimonas sp. TaxID=2022749 RepID=UPI002621AE13|nr:aldolase/citrate lyase family protein [Sulfurimonas sp.]MCW8895103.1 aldolase/citrate lyase family protein [Sulfurimonas sp.]MCW9067189.1 aldolase/citrate lyase family protein [Sulfurimonas sp.]